MTPGSPRAPQPVRPPWGGPCSVLRKTLALRGADPAPRSAERGAGSATPGSANARHPEAEPEQPQEHNSTANTKPDTASDDYTNGPTTSPLLQAAVRRQTEELELKEWTSLMDEQRCHHVVMDRFIRYTTEEDRQRDRRCNNTMFRRFVISQSSKPPIPCYYARAVVSHMGW